MEEVIRRIDKQLMLFEKKNDNGLETESGVESKDDKQDSNKVFTLSFPYDDLSLEQGCFEPFQYTVSVPGKYFRQSLIDMLNYWLKVPEDIVDVIKDVAHILHNISIMVDDIQDESLLRRGIPCAYQIFGLIPLANSLSLGIISSLVKVDRLPHPEVVKVYFESVCQLLRGQNMEVYWRDNFICPTIEEYKIMCCRSRHIPKSNFI